MTSAVLATGGKPLMVGCVTCPKAQAARAVLRCQTCHHSLCLVQRRQALVVTRTMKVNHWCLTFCRPVPPFLSPWAMLAADSILLQQQQLLPHPISPVALGAAGPTSRAFSALPSSLISFPGQGWSGWVPPDPQAFSSSWKSAEISVTPAADEGLQGD